ncbi:MAG: CdaR family protein [bacterium]
MGNRLTRFIRKLFAHPGVKLTSMIFAIIIWFIAQLYQSQERVINIPILFTDIPYGLVITNKVEDITIRIAGKGKDLLGIQYGDIKAEISLKNYEPTEYLIDIKKEYIKIPKTTDINLVSVKERENINIALEKLDYKWVPILPYLQGQTANDSIISGEIITSPSYALITGKSSLLKNVDYVRTRPVFINQATEDIHTTTKVISTMKEISVIKPDFITINIPISKVHE